MFFLQAVDSNVVEFIKIVVALTAVFATIIFGWYTHTTNRHNLDVKKTEWYFALFKNFFQDATYKEMRAMLDFKREDDIKRLKESLPQTSADRISESLFDYLNFFEFIAILWKSKKLTMAEVDSLFNYYIENIKSHDFIMEELSNREFDNLLFFLTAHSAFLAKTQRSRNPFKNSRS